MSTRKGLLIAASALAIFNAPLDVEAQDEDTDEQEESGDASDRDADADDRAAVDAPDQRAALGDRTEAPDGREMFGTPGQWAFSSDAALSLQRATQSDVDGSTTTVVLAPAADYFIVRNLSVGGSISLAYSKAGENTSTRFGLGPRIGYNIVLSQMLSVWPKLGFSYAHTNSKAETNIGGMQVSQESDSNGIALNLFAPVMVHPAPHFFAGFGPFLDTDLSGDNRSTVWGVKLTLGGWL